MHSYGPHNCKSLIMSKRTWRTRIPPINYQCKDQNVTHIVKKCTHREISLIITRNFYSGKDNRLFKVYLCFNFKQHFLMCIKFWFSLCQIMKLPKQITTTPKATNGYFKRSSTTPIKKKTQILESIF